MIPRAQLDAAEQALRAAGWRFDDQLDDYDQHYYRSWTHELPALRFPGHAVEVDLHHTILPPIGRLRPVAARLFEAAMPVNDSDYRVLCPADQVLHAAAHLFQDSDCIGRLRDLVDIDALVREFAAGSPAFWPALHERAHLLGLGRPLWYALWLGHDWLGTPLDKAFASRILRDFAPPMPARQLVLGLAARVLPPIDPDREPTVRHRLAFSLLELRALWLRMPPWTLAYHSIRKGLRAIVAWWRGLRAASA